MTGYEAWSFISPILARLIQIENPYADIRPMTQAYITVYVALKEYDKKHSEEGVRRNGHEEDAAGPDGQ